MTEAAPESPAQKDEAVQWVHISGRGHSSGTDRATCKGSRFIVSQSACILRPIVNLANSQKGKKNRETSERFRSSAD